MMNERQKNGGGKERTEKARNKNGANKIGGKKETPLLLTQRKILHET